MTLSARSMLSLAVMAALVLGVIFTTSPQARSWARHTWLQVEASLQLMLNGGDQGGAEHTSGGSTSNETGGGLSIGLGVEGELTPTP